jgi:hypothetical protein
MEQVEVQVAVVEIMGNLAEQETLHQLLHHREILEVLDIQVVDYLQHLVVEEVQVKQELLAFLELVVLVDMEFKHHPHLEIHNQQLD